MPRASVERAKVGVGITISYGSASLAEGRTWACLRAVTGRVIDTREMSVLG